MESPLSHFKNLPDPRIDRCKEHLLEDIIFIAISGVICGAEGWNEIAEFGEAKQDWLKTFLQLPNGIPSHDTFNRLFSALDPIAYYITSLSCSAKDIASYVRQHWRIENGLHWTLDVAFREDYSRKRTGNSAQNYSMLNRIALNLLKNEKSVKVGVKGKRLVAGWNNKYLIDLLQI